MENERFTNGHQIVPLFLEIITLAIPIYQYIKLFHQCINRHEVYLECKIQFWARRITAHLTRLDTCQLVDRWSGRRSCCMK